jgi:superfamily II DNA or RNA helicase
METTNTPSENLTKIKNIKYNQDEFLKYSQYIVKNFVVESNNRGCAMFWEMGRGKTFLAVSIADYYRENDPDRQIIILSPKSLAVNFRDAVETYIAKTSQIPDDKIKEELKKFQFVSINSSKSYDHLININKTDEEKLYDKKLGEIGKGDLENTLLIIDEAHNLFNSITNGSKNAMRIYDKIIKTKDIKLIFLTGTPMINHPFELAPCFNMLRGIMYYDNKIKMLLPEDKEDFDSLFVDYTNTTVKNKDIFKNRIYGLCSYYGSLYNTSPQPGFANLLPIIVEKVPMSLEQFGKYEEARVKERREKSFGSHKRGRFVKTDSKTSYRVQSRQLSNYAIPSYALDEKTKNIKKIDEKDLTLDGLKNKSPKLRKIFTNIELEVKKMEKEGGVGFVYSDFLNMGINLFGRIMKINGWEEITANDLYKDSDIEMPIKNTGRNVKPKVTKKYAIISGEVHPDDRENIIKVFNDEKNMYGEKINVLLVTGGTGAEGIDFKRIRHIHLMEPYWNYARTEQVIARAWRYEAHELLPEKYRTVQVYIYLSDYPDNTSEHMKIDTTTDINLYQSSLQNKVIIDQFLLTCAESSFDCPVYVDKKLKDKIDCLMCKPTNERLYHPDININIESINPCRSISEQKIKAKEIEYDGKKYYYTMTSIDDLKIYFYSKDLEAYTELTAMDSNYSELVLLIIK